MSKEKPDHHDAELVLRVYDMRREPVLRQSRAEINGKFWPKSYDDVTPIFKTDHPLNAAWRQVGTYWEMVYGMVKHGIVNPGYFLETNGEGLFLFARVQPFLDQLRKDQPPSAFRNAEWVATECPEGKAYYDGLVQRVKRIYEARAAQS
jgi:hypothetical protein